MNYDVDFLDRRSTDASVSTRRSGDDYRMGGLGRSRGRRAVFNIDKVRGMYDEVDEDACGSDEAESSLEGGFMRMYVHICMYALYVSLTS